LPEKQGVNLSAMLTVRAIRRSPLTFASGSAAPRGEAGTAIAS
jgi:hypothetical protein